jgi:hypothetical protein
MVYMNTKGKAGATVKVGTAMKKHVLQYKPLNHAFTRSVEVNRGDVPLS